MARKNRNRLPARQRDLSSLAYTMARAETDALTGRYVGTPGDERVVMLRQCLAEADKIGRSNQAVRFLLDALIGLSGVGGALHEAPCIEACLDLGKVPTTCAEYGFDLTLSGRVATVLGRVMPERSDFFGIGHGGVDADGQYNLFA